MASKKPIISEINITPLTDIFLVLLIIMMVVAPMMKELNSDIKPPVVMSGAAVDRNKLTVEVTADGEYAVDGESVSAEELTDVLIRKREEADAADGAAVDSEQLLAASESGEALPAKPEQNLIIRADARTRSGAVLKVFEAARDAQFQKVTVAGDNPEEGAGASLKEQQPVFDDTFGEGF